MRFATRTAAAVIAGYLVFAATTADAVVFKTYITGEDFTLGVEHVIFTVTFNPAVAGSASIVTTLKDPSHRLDGIDFVPGTAKTEVVAGGTFLPPVADGVIGHYNVDASTILPEYIVSTKSVPGAGITHPSSVKSTDTHFYYTENQFGFETGDPDRIMRAPFAGGLAEVVFVGTDAAVLTEFGVALEDLEGIEIHDDRMYFFARDPTTTSPDLKRALLSVPLTAGLAIGATPELELGGLTRGSSLDGSGPGVSDGSDELDFDPVTGLIWGTNIISGELIAFDPVSSTGAIVVDATDVLAGAPDGLGLLGRQIDGIRSTSEGHLVFTGLDGVIGSVDLAGFIGGGGLGLGTIMDSDVIALLDAPGLYAFDDLTPLAVAIVPEPGAFVVWTLLGLAAAGALRRRSRRSAVQ